MALIIGGTAANAVIVLYMATYAVTQLKLAPTTGLFAGITAGLITLLAAPIGGILADRFGRKAVARWSYGLIFLLIYPAFLYLNVSDARHARRDRGCAGSAQRHGRRGHHHHAR